MAFTDLITSAQIDSGGGDSSENIGDNRLTNNDPGPTHISRKVESTQPVVDYPDLAGKPGYPFDVDIASYQIGVHYDTSPGIFASNATSDFGFHSTDATGMSVASSGRDEDFFVKITTNSDTVVQRANSVVIRSSYNDPALGIFIGEENGNIEKYNYTTYALETTTLVRANSQVVYINRDNGLNSFVVVCIDATTETTAYVYTGASLSTLIFQNEITYPAASQIFFTKTSTGYLVSYRESVIDANEATVHYFPQIATGSNLVLDSSNKVIGVNGNSNDNIIFKSSQDKDTGNGLVSIEGDASMHRTTDGGQTFTQINPVGMSLDRVNFMAHIELDTYIALRSTEVYFTTDFGNTWTGIGGFASTGGNPMAYMFGTDVTCYYAFFTDKNIAEAVSPAGVSFKVSQLDSPNFTDEYFVKGR